MRTNIALCSLVTGCALFAASCVTPPEEKPRPKPEEKAVVLPPETAPEPEIVERQVPESKPVYREYVVKQGDTLSGIAYRFGVKVNEILEINKIKNPNRIRPEQKILLPAHARAVPRSLPSAAAKQRVPTGPDSTAEVSTTGREYVIKPGDTLEKIAKAHGVPIDQLKKANNLTSSNIIAGRKLVIPQASLKTEGPPSAAPALELGPGHALPPPAPFPPLSAPVEAGSNAPVAAPSSTPAFGGTLPPLPPLPPFPPVSPTTQRAPMTPLRTPGR